MKTSDDMKGMIPTVTSYILLIFTYSDYSTDIYTVLAGIGGFFAGISAALYYFYKILLLRRILKQNKEHNRHIHK